MHSLNDSVVFRTSTEENKEAWMNNIITEINQLTGNDEFTNTTEFTIIRKPIVHASFVA